ncbi:anhydro-N-acetylmuramic acid kinase [Sulfurimonas sp.]|uniref:anhydro-N-acetylmuramic acid kinase n=1 Tax=Sulfurimonas sp. TaxID=2022749 RepID=UPI003D0E440B
MTKYIGVMSGTSLDGIDVALCEVDENNCTLLCAHEYPFSQDLKDEILTVINGQTTLQTIGEIDVKLANIYTDAINSFIEQYQINKDEVVAIGLHGQTLWHSPESQYPFSLQLGSASIVATHTNIDVVNDFRSKDIANGGQGAPFAPAFHKFIFGKMDKNIAVVNIGGMANITLLGKNYLGWDSGCGNVLLDYMSNKIQNKNYDSNGEFAQSGQVIQVLLDDMLSDPYFEKKPPKSTGREYFNPTWLAHYLNNHIGIRDADIQATLTELTARTIVKDLNDVEEIILCGGGAKNVYLVKRIKELSQKEVKTSSEHGVDSNFLEAMIFAWLAYKRVHKLPVELKEITGTVKNSILGTITCSN